jgi:hypothetical protein
MILTPNPNFDKQKVLAVLRINTKLIKLDNEMLNLVKDLGQEKSGNCAWYMSYEENKEVIWKLFVDKYSSEVYHEFVTLKSKDKPQAWYTTQFSQKGDGDIPSKHGYGGFIPDVINGIVYDKNLNYKEKYTRLAACFTDLININKKFNKKKKE